MPIVSSFPSHAVSHLLRVLIGAADAGKRRGRRVAPQAGDGKADARPQLRQQTCSRRGDLRQLAAEEHEHAIRTFREHALSCAVGPLFVARQRADVLRPALDDLVRARQVLAADRAGNGREADAGSRALRFGAVAFPPDPKAHAKTENHEHRDDFTHALLREAATIHLWLVTGTRGYSSSGAPPPDFTTSSCFTRSTLNFCALPMILSSVSS